MLLDVDGVLFSTTGPGQTGDEAAAFAAEAQAHAGFVDSPGQASGPIPPTVSIC
jgi:hypothetical protein